MKKLNIIGSIAILLGIIGLALLRVTGLKAHIVISIVALIVMLVCMVKGKKDWKMPPVEILYRVFYLVALITGIVLALGTAPAAVAIVHKVCAGIFAGLFLVASIIAFKPEKK